MTTVEAVQILGISPNFTQGELKKAFKTLARKNHPDVAGVGATANFIKIKDAYDLLSISGSIDGKNVLTHQSIFTVIRQQ